MGLEFIAVILILVALPLSFRLRGAAARRARKAYAIGLVLILGGCVGSLAWLDAETSGSSNVFHALNPFIYAGMFIAGFLLLAVNSVMVISSRAEQNRRNAADMPLESASRESAPDEPPDSQGDDEERGSREF